MPNPSSTLPPELLVHIFSIHLPHLHPADDVNIDQFGTSTSSKTRNSRAHIAAKHLALVCEAWHAVWMNTPTLWSTLIADFTVSRKSAPEEIALLRQHAKHSANVPLDVLILSSFNFHDSQETEHALIQFLKTTSERWRMIAVLSTEQPVAQALLSELPNAPLLERVDLSTCQDYTVPPTLTLDRPPVSAHLRAVRLYLPDMYFPSLLLPWDKLTSLALTDIWWNEGQGLSTWQDALDMLRRCPNIIQFTCGAHQDTAPDVTDAVMHALNKLRIEATAGFNQFLDRVTLPLLRSLAIDAENWRGTSDEASWPGDMISSLVQRSKCVLTGLEISCFVAPPAGVEALLRQLPHLTKLILWSCSGESSLCTPGVLSDLKEFEDGRFINLPNLEELCIHWFQPVLFPDLVDLVEARGGLLTSAPMPQALRRFTCQWAVLETVDLDEERVVRLLGFRQRGMRISCICRADRTWEWLEDIMDGASVSP